MNEILFDLLYIVIMTAIVLLTRYFIPWLKSRTDQTKDEIIKGAVAAAVRFAEQTVLGRAAGAEKKAIVTEYLRELLTAKNITISDEQLNTLIESAVFTLKTELPEAAKESA